MNERRRLSTGSDCWSSGIDLDALNVESLRELQRVLRDLDHEKQAAVNRARLMPWTR